LNSKGKLQHWINSVPNAVSKAFDAIGKRTKKDQPIVDYHWAHVELSLEKKEFGEMTASVLGVETLDVIVPNTEQMAKVRHIYGTMIGAKEMYLAEKVDYVKQEEAAPAEYDTENPVDDDQPV
jgi:hypothetical protein